MPLDTQPLSRGRRLAMLAVLAALFCGSLGFAEYLVTKQGLGFEVVPRLEKVGFSTVEEPSLENEIAARTGVVAKRERLVQVFTWNAKRAPTGPRLRETAEVLFSEITPEPPQGIEKGTLLGREAVEVGGKDEQNEFTILRLTAIGRQVVAISYSGPLPYTDADKTTFNTICATGVELRK